MATVVVHPVAFRLVEERLMVWIARPATDERAPTAGSAETDVRSLPDRLPTRELSDSDSDTDALRGLLATLPFHREIVRSKHCSVFAEPGRVKRRREIALISWVLVRPPHAHGAGEGEIEGASGAWLPAEQLPPLLDDHRAIIEAAYRDLGAEILHDAVTRRVLPRHLLRSAADHLSLTDGTAPLPPALFGLLPDPFPLSAIRRFYERLLGAEIDRGNFRRKLVELRPSGILKELPIFQRGVRHRAAQLFTFDAKAWERWAATEDAADEGN